MDDRLILKAEDRLLEDMTDDVTPLSLPALPAEGESLREVQKRERAEMRGEMR